MILLAYFLYVFTYALISIFAEVRNAPKASRSGKTRVACSTHHPILIVVARPPPMKLAGNKEAAIMVVEALRAADKAEAIVVGRQLAVRVALRVNTRRRRERAT